MLASIVVYRSGDDRNVGLGLRLVVEPDGPFGSYLPPRPERRFERLRSLADRRIVRSSLRLGDDQHAADQLDVLTRLEHAELDEPVVLRPGEPSGPGLVFHDCVIVSAGYDRRQCPRTNTAV